MSNVESVEEFRLARALVDREVAWAERRGRMANSTRLQSRRRGPSRGQTSSRPRREPMAPSRPIRWRASRSRSASRAAARRRMGEGQSSAQSRTSGASRIRVVPGPSRLSSRARKPEAVK